MSTSLVLATRTSSTLHMQKSWPQLLRPIRLGLITVVVAAPAWAQFTKIEIERAPTLPALVAQLGAQAAQPSSYLKLDLPDVVLPGAVQAAASSALPGTTALVLVKGLYTSTGTAPAANLSPPPQSIPKRPAGTEVPPPPPPPVWIATAFLKAGQSAVLKARFEVESTSDYTLFAHSQGRWWFVTRQVKVGTPAPNQKPAKR